MPYLAGYTLSASKSRADTASGNLTSCGKVSGKGWLTANTVGSYIRRIVAVRKVAEEHLRYGYTDCFFVGRVLSSSLLNISPKHVLLITKADCPNSLGSITLFPILRDIHFVLLVFRRETLQLTLYDSIENNDNDRLLHEVHDRFIPFLQRLTKSDIRFSVDVSVVQQNESSSCGICVCMTAEFVCFERLTSLSAEQYRRWLLY